MVRVNQWKVLLAMLMISVAPRVAVAQLCVGDKWGIRDAQIKKLSEEEVRISAKTQFIHFADHPGCNRSAGTRASLFVVTGYRTLQGCKNENINSALAHDISVETVCPYLGPGDYESTGTQYVASTSVAPDSMSSPVHLNGPPVVGRCSLQEEYWCNIRTGYAYSDGCICEKTYSPLLVDVERNGFRMSTADEGVFFDLDGDGQPELTSWPQTGADDAWLVLDRNNDDEINNGTELFGNGTPTGNDGSIVANGFLALRALEADTTLGNGNGMVTSADLLYGLLRLWLDANRDGVAQPEELTSLSSHDANRFQQSSRRTAIATQPEICWHNERGSGGSDPQGLLSMVSSTTSG